MKGIYLNIFLFGNSHRQASGHIVCNLTVIFHLDNNYGMKCGPSGDLGISSALAETLQVLPGDQQAASFVVCGRGSSWWSDDISGKNGREISGDVGFLSCGFASEKAVAMSDSLATVLSAGGYLYDASFEKFENAGFPSGCCIEKR